MTSLKWRRYIELYVTLFGAQRRFNRSTMHYKGKLALYDDLNRFCGAICMLSRFVSNISVYRIIWKPIRYVQNRLCFKMSEISNIACRWVKTMPELLKPRPLHVHGNFVFSVCKLY